MVVKLFLLDVPEMKNSPDSSINKVIRMFSPKVSQIKLSINKNNLSNLDKKKEVRMNSTSNDKSPYYNGNKTSKNVKKLFVSEKFNFRQKVTSQTPEQLFNLLTRKLCYLCNVNHGFLR